MKLVDVNKSNSILKIIGTLRDPRINMDILKSQTETFINELNSYREDLVINSPELKVADILDENFIMSGKLPMIMVEAISKIGGTAYTLETFKDLGFSTETPELTELNGFMNSGYSALRTAILSIYIYAQKELVESPEKEVFLPMFREGIKIASKPFLDFTKYCNVKMLQPEIVDGKIQEDFITSHTERYNEWVDLEVERVLLSLFENPMDPAFVAPVGLGAFVNDLKFISESLYDVVTEFGSVLEPAMSIIKTKEFMDEIKKLDKTGREAVAKAITDFNAKNVTGKLATQGGEMPIPSAVSIIDATIGFLLHVGEVVVLMAGIVGENGTIGEMLDSIESEPVKAFIDLVSDQLTAYSNSTEIAINLLSIPAKLIPMFIFENPTFRITQVPELNELNANIYGLFFTGLDNEEE